MEQAIQHVLDGFLVIHQGAECLRVCRQEIFHAGGIRDNVGFAVFVHVQYSFEKRKTSNFLDVSAHFSELHREYRKTLIFGKSTFVKLV